MEITLSDVILIPGILVFFGAFIYGVAFANGLKEYNLPRYRWVGVALLILAALVGARTVWQMFDPSLGAFYRASLQSRKLVVAHYVSLLGPLFLVASAFVAEGWFKRFRREVL